nr:MAG TPA: hypothetical protein [Caudoviricetes sp.]
MNTFGNFYIKFHIKTPLKINLKKGIHCCIPYIDI